MSIVAFDLGQVLYHVDLSDFIVFTVDSGFFPDYLSAYNYLEKIQIDQDLGHYTFRKAFESIAENKINAACEKWLSIIRPSQPMITLVEELIDKGETVALLSNIGYEHSDFIMNQTKIFSHRRVIKHFSCQVGARKPSKLFFQSFIHQDYIWHGKWIPHEYLFFDDREENVKASEPFFIGKQFDLKNFANDDEAKEAAKEIIRNGYKYRYKV